jgi:hypothetical protein
MRALIRILFIAGLVGGCTTGRDQAGLDTKAARGRIVSALPAYWQVVPQDTWQECITGRYFTSPSAEAFVLLGSQLIYSDLRDRAGTTHREYLWKECVYVWIVPESFEPPFRRTTIYNFFEPPWRPHPVFASRGVKVYAEADKYILSTNRMDELFRRDAYSTSPQELHLSWKSWRRDIAASLKK